MPVKLTGSNKTRIYELITSLISELNELAGSSKQPTCLIVEGVNDEGALRSLGVKGPILRIYGNQRTIDDIEREIIQHQYKRVIILTDYDSEGQELAKKLEEYLKPTVKILTKVRQKLRKALAGWVEVIEAIPNFFSRVSP
ncbi:MAG: toprim domain-containing protein [Candidatus Heimdallarchaeota archaeon]|nr:toprim domain-containing protein [Candidatus Heimdallarchaeota archaeon]